MKKTIGLMIALSLGIGLQAGTVNAKAPVKDLTPQVATQLATDEVQGIQFFKGTWSEALAMAKKENKLIFLDAMASWCGPCKAMAKYSFTEKEVGDLFNKNFINVKMDMEKDKDGQRLSQKYGLRAYPTLYFIDSNENIVRQEIGMQKAKQLIDIGKSVLSKK